VGTRAWYALANLHCAPLPPTIVRHIPYCVLELTIPIGLWRDAYRTEKRVFSSLCHSSRQQPLPQSIRLVVPNRRCGRASAMGTG